MRYELALLLPRDRDHRTDELRNRWYLALEAQQAREAARVVDAMFKARRKPASNVVVIKR